MTFGLRCFLWRFGARRRISFFVHLIEHVILRRSGGAGCWPRDRTSRRGIFVDGGPAEVQNFAPTAALEDGPSSVFRLMPAASLPVDQVFHAHFANLLSGDGRIIGSRETDIFARAVISHQQPARAI